MPLDTSTYSLALLRLDGRRWNELRRIHAQISTQAAADGSSYLEMGNTKVLCTVAGPAEGRRGVGGGGEDEGKASIVVEVSIAGFSRVDRKQRGRGDKRTSELAHTVSSAFASTLLTHIYPRSTITISLNVLSLDGSLLAACLNASTLAIIDAGIPMADYIVACTAGSTSLPFSTSTNPSHNGNEENADPLLDLNGTEEQELPFLTVGTVGAGEWVSVLVMESRVRVERVEGMLAVGVDGCKQVREILDRVVRAQGKRVLDAKVG
ncbi:Exosome non-catalytic core component [Trapelia coarctata]|nr:Exosome non-catalytic core component [Trapelia coarctata]